MAHSGVVFFLHAVLGVRVGTSKGCAFFIVLKKRFAMKDLDALELDCLRECQKMEFECNRIWLKAIEFSPKLARYCNRFNNFNTGEWAVLLSHCPQFANIAPLHKLSVAEWVHILTWQPQLESECKIKRRFSAEQIAFLKSRQNK